jgi:hypothetical protein
MKRCFLFFLVCAVQFVAGKTADNISQYGITWYFDKAYECDTFANGDYWVLGPVTIKKITPEFTGKYNGFEVDPVYKGPQGFDIRIGPSPSASTFDAKLVPALPLTVTGLKSIIKTVGRDTTMSTPRPALLKAAVLTVVAEIPPGRGADVFRPPYVGIDKPYYYIKDIHSELLPKFPPIPNMPTLDSLYRSFKMVQMDHKDGDNMAWLRPDENIQGGGYAPTMAMYSNDAILRLMMNDPVEQKRMLLIVLLQKGIDMYHFALNGQVWPEGSGYQVGHLLPMAFTALLLANENMKKFIKQAGFYNEEQLFYAGANGKALFGLKTQYWSEERYWQYLATQTGGSAERDPYGYIDGGYKPGDDDTYLACCLAQPFKGEALAFQLFPDLKGIRTDSNFLNFADRWTTKGIATQPDPCAPPDGICNGGPNNGKPCTLAGGCPQGECVMSMANYGKTFGADPAGGCIQDKDPSDGIGRLPALNNTGVDRGLRSTSYQTDMWKKYRNYSRLDPTKSDPDKSRRDVKKSKNSIQGMIETFSKIAVVNTQGRVMGVVAGRGASPSVAASLHAALSTNGIYFFVCGEGSRRQIIPVASIQ